MSALGTGGPRWSEGDSPRPGERAEDPRYTAIVRHRPPLTTEEYLANVKRWGEVAKARKEKKP